MINLLFEYIFYFNQVYTFNLIRIEYTVLFRYKEIQETSNFYLGKFLAQLRLSTMHGTNFRMKNVTYKIDQKTNCTICNHQNPETIEHFLLDCPIYQHHRNTYLSKFILQPINISESLSCIFSVSNISELKLIYYYVANSLKLRSFILNE